MLELQIHDEATEHEILLKFSKFLKCKNLKFFYLSYVNGKNT